MSAAPPATPATPATQQLAQFVAGTAYGDLPASLQDKYRATGGWPHTGGGYWGASGWGQDVDKSDPTKRNRKSLPSPYGSDSISELEAWTQVVNDTSIADPSTWAVRTLGADNLGAAAGCVTEKNKVTGIVTTNATVYKAGAPEYDSATKTLNYKVSAPHYMSSGDVLVFLPGQREIREAARELESLAREHDLLVMPLFGELSPEQQDAALQRQAKRKIVLATNVAETSLTIEDVRIVVDCANGAAYKVAPTVLWELGAEVIPIGVTPNGTNINDKCGATSPEALQTQVAASGADLGIALDGDADRLIMVDEHSRVIDGDH